MPIPVLFSVRGCFLTFATTALCLSAGTRLGLTPRVFAQAQNPSASAGPLRLPYEDAQAPKRQREVRAPELPRKLMPSERDQLARTRENALRLAANSDHGFRRGLLPLGDHLRQLALSYSLRQSVATFGIGPSRETLNQQELSRYREIVETLEQFRQPAAEGWRADLALARSHLARVEGEQAYLQGDRMALRDALNRQVTWSNRHLATRELDHFLGMASPRQVIEAAQFERRSRLEALPRYPTSTEYRLAYQSYRDDLGDLVQNVERWSQQGAGLGRRDEVHRTRFALAQADAILGLLNADDSTRRRALQSAESELDALFETQTEFYRRGTVKLFEMARTWQERQAIYDQATDLRNFPRSQAEAAHARDFEKLETWAAQTRDRRGRIAADLAFISALKSERKIADLRNQLTDPFRMSGRNN